MADHDRPDHHWTDDDIPDGAVVEGGRFTPAHLAALVAGPLLALILLLLPPPPDMPPEAWRMVAVTAWIVTWWLTEAVPIPAAALIPLVAMPLFGVAEMDAVASSYADPVIFLFFGGFLLAAALQSVGLHRRIALAIVSAIGTSPQRIILGFMLATAFLSMWISNTATAVMMFTVGLSVVDFVTGQTRDDATVRKFGVALMLSIAYAASIGGVGTLIGTPPNALLASYLADNTEAGAPSFAQWMLVGVPIVAVMLPLAWLLLTRVLFRADSIDIDDPGAVIRKEVEALGPMRRSEVFVAVVFGLTALAWILRVPLAGLTGLPIDDTVIAITAGLVLFAVPISLGRGLVALDWERARTLPWGVLVLFGGGLALAMGFKETGLAEWIGQAVGGFPISPVLLVLLVVVAMVYLTEITSNTASTATFLPVLGAVAAGLSMEPRLLLAPMAIAASMAFMMPVATPPNAIVFGYERMELRDMVRAGFWLNLVGIAVGYGLFMTLGRLALGV